MLIRKIPVDSPWAWLIPIGGSLSFFFLGTVSWSFSLMMHKFQLALHTSFTLIIIGAGLLLTMIHLGTAPAWLLCNKLTPRLVFLIASIILSSSTLLMSLYFHCAIYIICMSLIGVGISFIIYSSIVVIENCFHRNIGLANSILTSGLSLGHIISPHLAVHVLENYTVPEVLTLICILTLNFLPLTLLLPGEVNSLSSSSSLTNANKQEPPSEKSHLFSSIISKFGSKNADGVVDEGGENSKVFILAALYLTCKMIVDSAENGLAFVYPLQGLNINLTHSVISWIISAAGVVGLTSRLTLGILADRLNKRPYVLLSFAIFMGTISGIVMTNASGIIGYSAAYGLYAISHSAISGLALTVLRDFVGHHYFATCVVLEHLLVPCPLLFTFVCLGKYKDQHGLVLVPILCLTLLMLLGGIVLTSAYFIIKTNKPMKEEKQ